MKELQSKLFIFCFLFLNLSLTNAQPGLRSNEIKKEWWHINKITPFIQQYPEIKKLSIIKVEGNSFIDDSGKVIVFKGLSISDPDKLVKDNQWDRKHFEVIKSWGANVIRIPVHPIAFHQRGVEEYIKLLDQAVRWCSELDIYVIIDWHAIGNLHMELLAHDMHNTTKRETFNFWRTISAHYKDVPTVAFYELFNEPTTYNGQYGTCSWDEWKALMEQLIDVVYSLNDKAIPLVAGFNWAYDLTPVRFKPIERPNVAYVTHPYPGKRKYPWTDEWEKDFGFVADNYPVFATEIGYMTDNDEDANLNDDGKYGPAIMNYFNKKGISWTVWIFDPVWVPQMIINWDYKPSQQGKFFRDVMQGKLKYKE
ncbi:glycoside hydrolase family 5 protein [Sphingobacterium phlebotomi]|uniref:Glycoside hydrolase family 5 protein n=1 Tax=Sphingobacterium phlebotomi TaxID=2605433 RepID=A0A5D4HAW9_9SPHI|nr:cellulase family glycosylhydrolase [Sphingobacterium phlebotomi]TYR37754.1 glycoside hydrolase family 5 protein [Sphingobacterium phlebotomi]